jgi:hypothetical protein
MNLRLLNDHGLEKAPEILEDLRSGGIADPSAILEDPALTVETEVGFKRPKMGEIRSRFDLALWLHRYLDQPTIRSRLREPGLWTWLSFSLFDIICPEIGGTRKVLQASRYIYDRYSWARRHRHLLAGPYFLYRAHADSPHCLRAILANAPESPGDLYEQMASRKPIYFSGAAHEVATRLYWDPDKQVLRRGARGSGPGSARRLADVLMQLDVTHDLIACNGDYLLSLLPREFTKRNGKADVR